MRSVVAGVALVAVQPRVDVAGRALQSTVQPLALYAVRDARSACAAGTGLVRVVRHVVGLVGAELIEWGELKSII